MQGVWILHFLVQPCIMYLIISALKPKFNLVIHLKLNQIYILNKYFIRVTFFKWIFVVIRIKLNQFPSISGWVCVLMNENGRNLSSHVLSQSWWRGDNYTRGSGRGSLKLFTKQWLYAAIFIRIGFGEPLIDWL